MVPSLHMRCRIGRPWRRLQSQLGNVLGLVATRWGPANLQVRCGAFLMRALPSLAFVFALISASHAQALSYGVAALPNGSTAIVAEGRIHRNEEARLLSSMQRAAAVSGSIPRTLVISSPGGELVRCARAW
jgi:hypothetical protein